MPIKIAGEDDVVPPKGLRVGKQLDVVERAGLREMAGRFVHVDRVPERDGGDDEVERHGPFLLGGVGAIMNASLRVGKYGPGQRVSRFALVEACMAFHAQVGVFDPVEHEERALDPADFTQGKVEPVLLAVRSKLAQDFRRFERLVADAGSEPHDITPMLPDHLFVDWPPDE